MNDEQLSNDEHVTQLLNEVDYHIACIEERENDDLDTKEKKRKVGRFLAALADRVRGRRVALDVIPLGYADSIEILMAKLASTEQALGQMQREHDRLSKTRDELRLAITVKQGTCLCAAQRHVSCSKQRPWCTVSDCLCDTCRLRAAGGQEVRL